jgi:sugar transferase (PEP-CTERM/EpsH1 system associated)
VRILTLTSKLPWPLTDGAVIRDFNLLREAARRHDVYLLCFLTKPEDRDHFAALRPYCRDIVGIDLVRGRTRALLNAARSLVTDRPYITAEYWRPEMAQALERVVQERGIDVIHSHFLHMSQYVGHKRSAAFVHDAHNLEHVLWRRVAGTLSNPLKAAFAARQCDKLLRLQQRVALASETCVTLSDEDRAEYLRICPEADVATVPNGADVEYWVPSGLPTEPDSIIYFGNLSWPPQADAAVYFHDHILPLVRAEVPNATLYIVGQGPPESVRRLAGDRVVVTGFVDDVRPYVERAAAVVMPLRAGAGTKHRVFQALALRKAIVCTPVAAEGIALTDGETALLASEPEGFARATVRVLKDQQLRHRLGEQGRALVLDRYDWRQIYERLDDVFREAVRRVHAPGRDWAEGRATG